MSITGKLKNSVKYLLLSLLYHRNPGCRTAKFDPEFPWIDDQIFSGENVTFVHDGGAGDILFSLYFCREITRHYGVDKFSYFIDLSENKLSRKAAEFMLPLLDAQEFISSAGCGEVLPETGVKLSRFRQLKINFAAGDIHSWYYNLTRAHLPREFWKPVLSVTADNACKDKILICKTARYNNVHIDWRRLEIFREHLIFAGLPQEHEDFCRSCFEIPYLPCGNMLKMAEIMAGAKGFIGNQSGIYSLAECLKIPRILMAPEFVEQYGTVVPGPHNNHPQGGWCEDAASSEKMLSAVSALLER